MKILLLTTLKKYLHIAFPVLMGLAVAGLLYGVYLRGHANGYSDGIGECNLQKQETIDENINTRKKQDRVIAITGKRDLIDRLRDDTAL